MTLEINFATVQAAASIWKSQADQLRGATSSLDEVDSSAVGDRAAGALAVYVDHWSDRLRGMQSTSQEYGESLSDVAVLVLITDGSQAADLSGLLVYQP